MPFGYQIGNSIPRTIFCALGFLLVLNFGASAVAHNLGFFRLLPSRLQRIFNSPHLRLLPILPHDQPRLRRAVERLRNSPTVASRSWEEPITGESRDLLLRFGSDPSALPVLVLPVRNEHNAGYAGFCIVQPDFSCVTLDAGAPRPPGAIEIPLVVLDEKLAGYRDFTLIHEWGHFYFLHDLYPGWLWWFFELVHDPRLWLIDTVGRGADWIAFFIYFGFLHFLLRKPVPPATMDRFYID